MLNIKTPLAPGDAVRVVRGTCKGATGKIHKVMDEKTDVLLDGGLGMVCIFQTSVRRIRKDSPSFSASPSSNSSSFARAPLPSLSFEVEVLSTGDRVKVLRGALKGRVGYITNLTPKMADVWLGPRLKSRRFCQTTLTHDPPSPSEADSNTRPAVTVSATVATQLLQEFLRASSTKGKVDQSTWNHAVQVTTDLLFSEGH